MLPWAAASAPSAPNRQFVTACEVSTLPATTAAGYSGDTIDFFGMTMLIGRRQPPFIGQEPDHRHRSLLRARRERPRGGGAKQRNERAALHSITPSARASTLAGSSR